MPLGHGQGIVEAVWIVDSAGGHVLRMAPEDNRMIAQVPLRAPSGIAVSQGVAWVLSFETKALTKIDTASNQVLGTVQVPGSPNSIVAAEDRVWVGHQASWDGLSRIAADPLWVDHYDRAATPLAAGHGGVWFREPRESDVCWLMRFDVRSETWLDIFGGPDVWPGPVLFGEGRVFVGRNERHRLAIDAFDPTTGEKREELPLPRGSILGLALQGDSFLVAHYQTVEDQQDFQDVEGRSRSPDTPLRRLLRVNRESGVVQGELVLPGDGLADVAASADFAFLLDSAAGAILRVDPRRMAIVGQVGIDGTPTALVV